MATPETQQRVKSTAIVKATQSRNGKSAASITVSDAKSEPAHLSGASSHLAAASALAQRNGEELDKSVTQSSGSNPSLVDSDGELEVEEEEDILGTSIEGDEVGKLLRTTVSELEAALQVFIIHSSCTLV